VSRLIHHAHYEEPFNDFERQRLLPKRLSQLGPGIAWGDIDRDGWEDLIIGSGKGGPLAVFRNNGKGGFEKLGLFDQAAARDQTTVLAWHPSASKCLLLTGSANYEDGLSSGAAVEEYDPAGKQISEAVPAWQSSVGPIALADVSGNGTMDLFVGGRVLPGSYPQAASSRIYHCAHGRFELTQELKDVGMVSGAVWSDLDGDGYPELILACEWGPIRIFHNDHGRLSATNFPVSCDPTAFRAPGSALDNFTGWWNGVTTGDLDGDGRMDIIASNWGQNTVYEGFRDQPLKIYFGDFNNDGGVQLLEASFAPEFKQFVPWRGLNPVADAMPWVRARFSTHAAYARASVQDVLAEKLSTARQWQAAVLESMVFLNRGDHFEARPLPATAQLSPAFGVCVGDLDGDGNEDVVLSQNFFSMDTETARQDAGRGLWLRGDGRGGLSAVPGQESGIEVYGEQRGCALCDYDGDGRPDLVITQNGSETKLFHNTGARPGLRVRLKGPQSNPTGVGAQMRLRIGTREGPTREVHAGSGYWSQDSAIQVLSTPQPPNQIRVRWPGGKTTTSPIPSGAKEITVSYDGN
jgi:hypothetical protein